MEAQALTILAVSEDRTALRQLTKFLTAFGYQVFSAAGSAQAMAAVASHPISFLIIDDRVQPSGAEVCRRLTSENTHERRFIFLLSHHPKPADVAEALASGVDDFLTRPLVYGELLARLRAGARALENRRRWGEQAQLEATTGLPSKAAFRRRLEREVAEMRKTSQPVACVVLDVDFFHRVSRKHGQSLRDELLGQIAQRLEQLIRPTDELACFGNDRFGLLMQSSSDKEAVAEAERICAAFAESEFTCGSSQVALTTSAGVACWRRDLNDAGEIMERAEKALEAAKCSGRNCAVRHGQFGNETQAWHELAAPGRLFESTKARDVMTPCPLTLNLDDPFHKATTIFEQTELLAMPVVDHAGKFAGIVWRESFINGSDVHETYPASHLNGPVSEQLDDAVECVEEEAPFAELVERLSGDSTPLLVVASGQHPTGMVTPPTLASLSQPLSADSFRSSTPFDHSPRYLAVTEHIAS